MEGLEMVVGAACGPRGKLDASQPLGHGQKNGKAHPFTLFEKGGSSPKLTCLPHLRREETHPN